MMGRSSVSVLPGQKFLHQYSVVDDPSLFFLFGSRYNMLRKKFPLTSFTGSPVLSDLGLDLLNKLLTYDPEKVINDL